MTTQLLPVLPPIPTEIRRDFLIETQSWFEESRRQVTSITIDTLLPDQTGNSGKYLTTDGTNASWGTVSYSTLSDVTNAFVASAIPYTNSDGTALTHSSSLTFDDTTLAVTGALTVSTTATVTGAFTASSTATIAGVLSVDDTTNSTSGITGSIHTDGGLGVVKDLWVASKATIGGTANETQLTVTGNASQTATLADFNDSGGTQQMGVASDGAIQMGGVDVIRITDTQTETSNNIFIGADTPTGHSGTGNIAIGYQAYQDATSASNGIAIGVLALGDCTSGNSNFSFGNDALRSVTTGGNNTAMGNSAGKYITAGGNGNVAMGNNALKLNVAGAAITSSIGIGLSAGGDKTGGFDFVAIGSNANRNGGNSTRSVYIGSSTGRYRTGTRNTFVGYFAGGTGTTSSGVESTYIGSQSGYLDLSSYNTFIGTEAAYEGMSTYNVVIGRDAVRNGTLNNGAQNVVVGAGAGDVLTGDNNVLLGYNNAQSLTTGDLNIIIGASIDVSSATVSNELKIGGLITGNMASGSEKLTINGEFAVTEALYAEAVETVTASSDTLDRSNHTVECDCSSNAITINLPAASGNTGLEYEIGKVDSTGNIVTIDPNGSETITTPTGAATTITITVQATFVKLRCNGTNWVMISQG